jgi:hypothetical protein
VEGNLLVGQLSVDSGICISASLNIGLVTSIEVNLKDTLTVHLAAGALSSDLSGVDNVLKDSILDSSQGTGAGTQSLGLLGTSIALSKDVTLSNNDDVTSRELLLQLANKTSLDLVEGLLELEGHVHNDGLASRSTVNLLGGGDVQVTEGSLQLSGGHLKVEKLLGDLGLEFIWLLK